MQKGEWRNVFAVFLRLAKPYRGWIAFLGVVSAAAYGAEMVLPWGGKLIIDRLSEGPATWGTVAVPFAIFSALSFADWFLWRVSSLIARAFEPRMVESGVKRFAFERIFTRPASYFADTASGSVVRYVERFAESFNELFNVGLYNILPTVLAISVSFVSLLYRSWVLAAIFAGWTVSLVWVQWHLAKKQAEVRRDTAAAEAVVSGRVADAVGNALTVKTFAAEVREQTGLRRAVEAFVKKERAAWLKEDLYWGLQSFFFTLLEIGLVGYVLYGWTKGTFTLGDFILVQGFVTMLYRFLSDLGRTFRRIPRIFANAADIAGMAADQPDVVDAPGAKPLRVVRGDIRFHGVSFAYKNGRSILKDFSLQIRPGEKVAFVGPSGAGKSTVVKLLYRFYDPKKGTIEIDGQDVAAVTQESLRRQLSLVPQDPALFHRSVLENIRYARPSATEKEVVAAAKKAYCHDFITRLADGYHTPVGERGVKLSGGEKQRVALARAILADTPILLLDEATSALDSESESLIQKALHELMADKTVVVIAHRLSTIMQMDRIVVIENGGVAAQGTHDALLKRGGTYKHLWNLQSGGYIQE